MIVIISRMAAVADASTRERLLAAAVEVFVEHGYEGARLQDIARAAGLTTGAVYANFRGKDELLFAAIGARAGAEVDAMLAEASGRGARELLGLLGDQLVHARRQPPLLIDAIATARRDEQLAAALRARLAERERGLAVVVERAKVEGTIGASVDADAFARFGLTLAMGALVLRTLRVEPPAEGAWHELISRLLDAISEEQPDA